MAYSSDVAFTPAVKRFQEQRGSRAAYARMESERGWKTAITEELTAFIAERDSFYLATSNAAGQPYVQHRGGPKGFLRAIDETTLAFADYRGNRQYITTGNLSENPKAFIFLMDYAERARVKIWGEARVVAGDARLTESLFPAGYAARAEQTILFKITAWDGNCRSHIPQKFDAATVAAALLEREERIKRLEAEIAALTSRLNPTGSGR